MVQIDVPPPQVADFTGAEPVVEHQQQHGRIAPAIAGTPRTLDQGTKFVLGEIVARPLVRVDGTRGHRTVHSTPSRRGALWSQLLYESRYLGPRLFTQSTS